MSNSVRFISLFLNTFSGQNLVKVLGYYWTCKIKSNVPKHLNFYKHQSFTEINEYLNWLVQCWLRIISYCNGAWNCSNHDADSWLRWRRTRTGTRPTVVCPPALSLPRWRRVKLLLLLFPLNLPLELLLGVNRGWGDGGPMRQEGVSLGSWDKRWDWLWRVVF